MSKSFFREPWFAWRAFEGIKKAMHGRPGEAESLDDGFVAQLGLHLLDQQRNEPASYSQILDFLAFCQPLIRASHAQILQDLWVLFMLDGKRNGYFVEFGACDGKLLSNTLLLEQDYGWNGILAEPNPVWHEALANNRSCSISKECVYTESDHRIDFKDVGPAPELSRIQSVIPDDIHERNGNRGEARNVSVKTISLLDLLRQFDAPDVIDYVSIDTEGSEYEILRAFDFSTYHFRLVSVEHAGQATKRTAIEQLLANHGYHKWEPALSRWDD